MIRSVPVRVLLVGCTLALVGTGAGAAAARTASPRGATFATGANRSQVATTAAHLGDCELATVHCKPAVSGSCTGYSSQSVTPASIRVLVRTSETAYKIVAVPFETYVEDVLPNEWIPSWDGDALKAGAVAVKSYAWYWITHYGGYTGSTATSTSCFDVTDDPDFQAYNPANATARTTAAVQATWPVAARVGGQILQAFYRATLTGSTTEACGAGATGTTLSQWGTQNCVEANTGNKYNVILARYYSGVQLATTRQLRTLDDFTFTQRSTPAFFSAGSWSIADGYPTSFNFGQAGDVPTVTNTGDGFARIGVFRPSTGYWYLGSPTGAIAAKIHYGQRGDIPVQAHYNGLSAASVLAVFRPSTDQWYLSGQAPVVYGHIGDQPVPADYTGDGAADIAVWRPSTGVWYVRGGAITQWGLKGDIPVPADYDGNGTADLAIYRPSSNTFYVRGSAPVHWGQAGDVPVTGDFNGDGRADLAIYRPSTRTWWIRGVGTVVAGAATGTPIGAAPAHN